MNAVDIEKELYPVGHDGIQASSLTPHTRLIQMILEDKESLSLICIYTFVSGLLSLAIPLATQIVVNTIAAGVFLQPLSLIAAIVFIGLTLAAMLRLLTFYLVEQIRQRTFARTALRLAYKVPKVKYSAFAKEYLPELVHRFFDTITLQSGWFNFLLDVPAAALQVIVGLLLLTLYSPWLLLLDLGIIVFFMTEIFILGQGGYKTRSDETTQRYLIAEWLEEIASCEIGLKLHGTSSYVLRQTDDLLVDYVKYRRLQFDVLFRQASGLFIFQAMASAAVLGCGGMLVISRQLTMGQLVAALLVVNMMLPALERLVRNFQNVYEILSALEKIGYVEDLPVERVGGQQLANTVSGAKIDIRNLYFAYDDNRPQVLRGVNLNIDAGERISLFGPNGSGKTTLAKILCGLLEPLNGQVQINGLDIRDLDLIDLRRSITMMSDSNEIFHGTILDNVCLGREDITHDDILWALNLVHFDEELSYLPKGLATILISGGRNLSRGQVQKLLLARAIARHPKLLIFDEAFTAIEEKSKVLILDTLYSNQFPWTIVDISHDADSILRSSRIVILSDGEIVETGTPSELINKPHGETVKLFPQLVALLKSAT